MMSKIMLSTTLHSVRNVRHLSVVACNKTWTPLSPSKSNRRDLCGLKLRNSIIWPASSASLAARWCSTGSGRINLSSVSGASLLSSKNELLTDLKNPSDNVQMRESITHLFTNCASDNDLTIGIMRHPPTSSFSGHSSAVESVRLSSDSASDISSKTQSLMDISEKSSVVESIRHSDTTVEILGGMTESVSHIAPHTASLTGSNLTSETVLNSVAETEILPVIDSVSEPPVSGSTSMTDVFSGLPEIPAPPSVAPPVEIAVDLLKNGEPSLASIGLGGWGPTGLVEEALMSIHVNLGLPWWGTIILSAACLRLCLFPLTIKSQRASAKMAVTLPQQSELFEKFSQARKQDDPFLVYKYSKELQQFQKCAPSPFASIWPGLAQIPFIYCFFSALREMSTVPVESFKTGGVLWFVDLTTIDPYYGLQSLSALGLFVMLRANTTAVSTMKYGAYIPYVAAPISFIFSMWFQNAVCIYWVGASVINLGQLLLLRNQAVRTYLDLPPIVRPVAAKKTIKKKSLTGMYKDMRKNMDNSRIAREVEDRFRLDSIAFEKAGKEPIRRTFKVDPTKVVEPKKLVDSR